MNKDRRLAKYGHFEKDLAEEVNRLHAEVETFMIGSATRAIKVGELLSKLKVQIGHGKWRRWVETNLNFSYRTCRRYIHMFKNCGKFGGQEPKTMAQAEKIFSEALKLHGMEASEADEAAIKRALIQPIRAVRGRLRELTYIGDDARNIEEILAILREEVQGLLEDLSSE